MTSLNRFFGKIMDSQGKFAYLQTLTASIIIKWTDVVRAVV